jgi:aminopeptidase C
MKTRRAKILRRNKTQKRFLYNPNNPAKSFNVYIDKNSADTIPIKYTTLEDVETTIRKLEHLYITKRYSHKRIWQVGMILYVRLKVIKKLKPEQFALAQKYFKFLGHRTTLPKDERYKLVFKFS